MKRAKSICLELGRTTLLLFFIYTAMVAAGCQPQGSGFLKKQFLTYQKVAILPFEADQTGEVSQAFTFSFKEKYPQMEVYDQYRLLQIFKREDLYPNQISQATRAKISETLGAQAVIEGSVYYPSITSWYLQVRVIETQTGETLGTSYVEMQNMGAGGMRQACFLAVQQLTPRE
jgi:TolB-like protein